MTRKKWLRLRKQRPELFVFVKFNGVWELMDAEDKNAVRRSSKQDAVSLLVAHRLACLLRGGHCE